MSTEIKTIECPNCKKQIGHVELTIETGGFKNIGGKIESNENGDLDVDYFCPECNKKIPNELVDQHDPAETPETIQKIIVIVEGGIIQGISGIPPGIEVEVHDHDVDGIDEDKLSIIDDVEMIISTWPSDNQ